MKVGTVVRLKQECLGNPVGTLGVVFNDYGSGSQIIFKNGEYDGFSGAFEIPRGEIEQERWLEEVGINLMVAKYAFTNVRKLSRDFEQGYFNSTWGGKFGKVVS